MYTVRHSHRSHLVYVLQIAVGVCLLLLLLPLAVHGADGLTTGKQNYNPSEEIRVEFSGFPGNATDWITIVPAANKDDTYNQWFYLDGKQSGTLVFHGLPSGQYEVRGYYNWPEGKYEVKKRHGFTVGVPAGNVTIKTEKLEYQANEPIVVVFSGLSGSRTDWITVVPSYFPLGKYQEWHYTDGKKEGRMQFGGLPEGEYEARVYFDWPAGAYIVQGSYTFRVR